MQESMKKAAAPRTRQKKAPAPQPTVAVVPGALPLTDVRSARNAMARVITGYLDGTVQERQAKAACALLAGYVTTVMNTDFEDRLQKLEERSMTHDEY